jgi:hypothetical protein
MDRPEDRVALIEVLERDGRSRRTLDVHGWPVSVGRALDNTLVLDEPHVAPRHATLLPDAEGRLAIQVGESVNGVVLDGRHLAAGSAAVLPPGGASLQLGGLRLRLRLPGELLAAERPLAQPAPGSQPLLAMALAWALLQAAERWLVLDPGADLVLWLPWVLGLPVGLAMWCGTWALGSKLFRHGFDFAGHAAIVLPGLLALALGDHLLPLLAAALDWPLLWHLQKILLPGLIATLVLRGQLLLLLPQRGRIITGCVAAMLLAGLGVNTLVNQRQTGWPFADPYMRTVPPPVLRLGSPVPMATVGPAMLPLRDALADRVRQDAIDHPDAADED